MRFTKYFMAITAFTAIIIWSINSGCVSKRADTPSGTFSRVRGVLSTNCDRCHADANADIFGNGIKLKSYDDVLNWVDSTTSDGDSLQLATSTLYQDVIPQNGKKARMPKFANSITYTEIQEIKAWILKGAPNN